MHNNNNNLEAMAWPGFVDILSSVIIMFVFVMVVASALYFHILIFKSQVLSEQSVSVSAQSEAVELAKTNRFLMEKIKTMEEDMKLLEEISESSEVQLFKEDAEFSESQNQTVKSNMTDKNILIFFDTDSISVTAENQILLNDKIREYISQYGAEKIRASIISSKNSQSINDIVARRLAVARMLNVRNSFLQTDIPRSNIKPIIKEGEAVDESYNWVKIQFNIEP